MGLIVYECQRADHVHEIRQFAAAAQSLYDYFDGREETVLFIVNVNIGEANLDGLIIKQDAIVIVEFKDYEGNLEARQNGDWTCNGKVIKGGSGAKSVFEQLKKNQRILRKVIAENQYLSESQRSDIKGLVVLTKLNNYSDDFDRTNKAWIYVSDVTNIGNKMHDIASGVFRDHRTGRESEISFSEEDIFNFLRKLKIDESALVTDFTDTTIMPEDLYNKDNPHNGKHYSTATLLKRKTEEAITLKSKLEELLQQMDNLKVEYQKVINEKDLQINQQKAEILQITAEKLESDKVLLAMQSKDQEKATVAEDHNHPITQEDLQDQEETIVKQIEEISDNIGQIVVDSSIDENTRIIANSAEKHENADGKPKKRKFGMKERILKEFNIVKEKTDPEQLGLIERELENSMIVSGCAGSGKSVIAMYKAQQIIDQGGDVILIAYTKSLNRYMQQGKDISKTEKRFYYHWEWKDAHKPSADYIIVDEIQDFSRDEVEDFINAAKKCFFFFGDTAQSIYGGVKKALSISELSKMTGVKISYLNSNYRLPKPVAKITQEYVAIDANPYSEGIYQSKETELPRFVQFDNETKQIDAIIDLINKKRMRNVGILVPRNEQVLSLMKAFNDRDYICEYKYRPDNKRSKVTLDFTTEVPKLMTYHSAKGLQFETVILPFFEGANSDDKDMRKALYVAMTRTYRFLYVMYTGSTLQPPLDKVPEHLYLKTLFT